MQTDYARSPLVVARLCLSQDEVSSEWIDVTVASLDEPKTFPPEVAIWTEDKLPWVTLDPSRRAFRRNRDENAQQSIELTASRRAIQLYVTSSHRFAVTRALASGR